MVLPIRSYNCCIDKDEMFISHDRGTKKSLSPQRESNPWPPKHRVGYPPSFSPDTCGWKSNPQRKGCVCKQNGCVWTGPKIKFPKLLKVVAVNSLDRHALKRWKVFGIKRFSYSQVIRDLFFKISRITIAQWWSVRPLYR